MSVNEDNPNPVSTDYSAAVRPLNRAIKYGSWALVVITILSLMGWGYFRDLSGIYGVLLGAAIGGGFVLLTAISVKMAAKSTPAATAAVVLGTWLVKLVVLIVILALIKDMTFYDTMALFVTVILALIAVLSTEVWGVITTNATFVD